MINSISLDFGQFKVFQDLEMYTYCAVHVVPMINPDGVTISQYGLSGLKTQEARSHIEAIAQREGGQEMLIIINVGKPMQMVLI